MSTLPRRYARCATIAVLMVFIFLFSASVALAEPISLTAYVTTANDLVDGLQAQIPSIVGAVIALGGGLIFIMVVWRLLKRFVK